MRVPAKRTGIVKITDRGCFFANTLAKQKEEEFDGKEKEIFVPAQTGPIIPSLKIAMTWFASFYQFFFQLLSFSANLSGM